MNIQTLYFCLEWAKGCYYYYSLWHNTVNKTQSHQKAFYSLQNRWHSPLGYLDEYNAVRHRSGKMNHSKLLLLTYSNANWWSQSCGDHNMDIKKEKWAGGYMTFKTQRQNNELNSFSSLCCLWVYSLPHSRCEKSHRLHTRCWLPWPQSWHHQAAVP